MQGRIVKSESLDINSNNKKKKNQYDVKKNKRSGGRTSDGMKRYNKSTSLVKCDWRINREFKIDYKCQKMYRNKEETQDIFPLMILSDVHKNLGNTCVTYNDVESLFIINKKITITETNDKRK